jgi:hypothetical protein
MVTHFGVILHGRIPTTERFLRPFWTKDGGGRRLVLFRMRDDHENE